MHCASSTVASRARRRVHSSSAPSGCLPAQSSLEQVGWSVGHRVRVRASAPGKAPRAAVILNTSAPQHAGLQYDVLFDDETTGTVEASQLLRSPVQPSTLLRLQAGQRPKGVQAEKGLLARTAEPDEQR